VSIYVPQLNSLDLTSLFFSFYVFSLHNIFYLQPFVALNGLLCANVPLRDYSLTPHSLCSPVLEAGLSQSNDHHVLSLLC